MIQIVTTPKHVAFVQWFFFQNFLAGIQHSGFWQKKFKKKISFGKVIIYFETEEGFKKRKMGDLKLPPFFGFGNDSFVDSTTNSKDHIVAKYVIIT